VVNKPNPTWSEAYSFLMGRSETEESKEPLIVFFDYYINLFVESSVSLDFHSETDSPILGEFVLAELLGSGSIGGWVF
jgi:hypothetical protein